MIKVLNKYKSSTFEYIYMVVMVIYMAQMTPETSRMVGQLSGNPIPFLLPIILTAILIKHHPISFKSIPLIKILTIISIWSIAIIIKEKLYNTEDLSYIFFLYYAIFIAYIHAQIYGKRLFLYYEDILTKFCYIAFFFWGLAVIIPGTASFFRLFPETSYGNNILYLFCWMDPAKGQVSSSIIRNAGCSWEPGRFAIMILPAIFFNISRNGIKFKRNKNIIILLLTLLSTQSTTGYSICMFLYAYFFISHINIRYILISIFLISPIIYGISQLDFMKNKISSQLDIENSIEQTEKSINYASITYKDYEYRGSLGRFQAIYFEWKNIINDPLLGYSRNTRHSYFSENISTNFVLTGGIIKLFGQYGIPLGLFLYCILFYSSIKIATMFHYKQKLALGFIILLSSISYITFCVPIFTTFWFYGYFYKRKKSLHFNKRAVPSWNGSN